MAMMPGRIGGAVKLARQIHSWSASPAEAVKIQQRLASRIVRRAPRKALRFVAGLDAAFPPGGKRCVAAVVVWDKEERKVVERAVAFAPLRFPYIPGLLSFREAPALLAALRKLAVTPDVLMCDGQGLAHPRRLGIACHVGLLAGLPSIGCAKSLLLGEHAVPGVRRGSRVPLIDRGERVGTVLRTRAGVKPVYISVGHLMDLDTAERIVLACGAGYRLPEPTRLADQAVGREASARRTH
ncbi:MAG: Endonuclease V [Verrucomicrobia bacterium ADurb.Bin345]|nr:MAG: Endonuclease V [Verrucomicrobia bacterium ADurb.Bin345]